MSDDLRGKYLEKLGELVDNIDTEDTKGAAAILNVCRQTLNDLGVMVDPDKPAAEDPTIVKLRERYEHLEGEQRAQATRNTA